jgi:probable HAF family extracellular repeat protein
MASTAPSTLGRRLGVLIAGAVVATSLTAATAAAARLAPMGEQAAGPSPLVAGSAPAPEDVGYVLERGQARTVAVPGATRTIAAGINDRGEVVGKYQNADGRDHGFLRDRWGRYRRIDVPGAGGTEPYKLNDHGQLVGSYNPQGPSAGAPGSKGFLLDRGRFITIQGPGAVYTQAEGINDAGVVVGEYLDTNGRFHGFRWHRGRLRTIEVPGATSTSIGDINDDGDLVGVYGDATGGPHGFVLRNRPHARVERIDVPGARYSLALGINNRRHVVGAAGNDIAGSDPQGFVRIGTFRPIEIRGSTRTAGLDINNRGQIVATIYPAVPDQQPGAMTTTPATSPTADSPAGAERPSSTPPMGTMA